MIGVVANVPATRPVASGDIYVPLTTAKTDAYRQELLGDFIGLLLARSPSEFPGIKAELESRLKSVEMPDKEYDHFVGARRNRTSNPSPAGSSAPARTCGAARNASGRRSPWPAFLFLLLPTVNLVNLNVSRIMERASEIGVRKSFGASSWTLVGQFVVENVSLTLVGGMIGFVLSAVVLYAISAAELIPYAHLRLNLRVFLYGVGLVAGLRPALRRLSGLAHVAASSRRRAERSRAMIRHLLRIVWNRRRTNLLIAIEIFLSFLVLVTVLTLGLYLVDNYRQPLGFVVPATSGPSGSA